MVYKCRYHNFQSTHTFSSFQLTSESQEITLFRHIVLIWTDQHKNLRSPVLTVWLSLRQLKQSDSGRLSRQTSHPVAPFFLGTAELYVLVNAECYYHSYLRERFTQINLNNTRVCLMGDEHIFSYKLTCNTSVG